MVLYFCVVPLYPFMSPFNSDTIVSDELGVVKMHSIDLKDW